jgi:very-short-patch-repair endonuclease
MTTEFAKTPRWHVSTKQRVRARSLRANFTNAERIIWSALRSHRMNGASFRRQTPIGPYIVDFVCHAARLVIEIDGGQHFESKEEQRDARRDAYLTGKGFRVLRFNNHDVMSNRQGVLETIAAAIEHAPSLALPRKRGRGRTEHAAAPSSEGALPQDCRVGSHLERQARSAPSPACGGGVGRG